MTADFIALEGLIYCCVLPLLAVPYLSGAQQDTPAKLQSPGLGRLNSKNIFLMYL